MPVHFDKMICAVYVDDTLLFSPCHELITKVLVQLRAHEMGQKVEDIEAGVIGDHVQLNSETNARYMSEKGLIAINVMGKDCFVDAGFEGMWGWVDSQDPTSEEPIPLSPTSHGISYCQVCPIN